MKNQEYGRISFCEKKTRLIENLKIIGIIETLNMIALNESITDNCN